MNTVQEQFIKNVYENKIIAIVRGLESQKCLRLAEALQSGGINMLEITFDQAADDGFRETLRGIEMVSKELGQSIYIGAGTVLNCSQVKMAFQSGAGYIVTPNVDEEVIQYAASLGMVTMPGAMTPTEIMKAFRAGADFVKIFPAADLGSGYIKAVKAPLKHIPLLAVGGINENNAADYIKAGAVGIGVGGNLVNKEWIEAGEYDKITALAKEMVRVVKAAE